MAGAPTPPDEAERLEELRRFGVLDTPPERRFDRLTRLVAGLLDVPISLVSLVDSDRQWFKSKVGLAADETPRELAFCAHAILGDKVLIVPDAADDARFRDNPLVTGDPNIRFYAGAPLVTGAGKRVGTLCAIDRKPRELTAQQRSLLQELAAVVVDELELSASLHALAERTRQLTRRNDELRTFSHALSHDFRGPIRRIRSFCELVDEDGLANSAEHFEHIARSAETADALLSALRSYFEVGRERTVRACSSQEILEQSLATLEDAIVESGARVDAKSLPVVQFAPGLLLSVFTNLIDNAIKYRSDDAPIIRVSCRRDGGSYEFEVADNGRGIRAEHLDRALAPFCRLTSDPAIPGSGLGLSICQKILEKSGGALRVESDFGRGSRFYFTVPASP